jgi:phosphoserine phosphatase
MEPPETLLQLQVDESLLSRVQQLAGAKVHQVATWVSVYQNSIWLYNKNPSPGLLEIIERNEEKLRAFVASRR